MPIIDRHTIPGARILGHSDLPVLRLAASIALQHHERWDGAGGPYGRHLGQTPPAARIVAVADLNEQLTRAGTDGRPLSLTETLAQLEPEAGRRLDPQVVAAVSKLARAARCPRG